MRPSEIVLDGTDTPDPVLVVTEVVSFMPGAPYHPDGIAPEDYEHDPGLVLGMRHDDEHGADTYYTGTLTIQADDVVDITVVDEYGKPAASDVDRVARQLMRDEWHRMQSMGHEVVLP